MEAQDSRKRRRYSPALKERILAECAVPGASVAKVALSQGINANIVHGWRKLAREGQPVEAPRPQFVPVTLAAAVPVAEQRGIEIEFRRGPATIRLTWPPGASSDLANRLKVLVHDGIGVWLAARRLNSGKFVWPKDASATLTLSRAQFEALVLGLPWQRVGEAGVITVL